jgi:transcriptional regulator with XRE-family HTH domain
MEKRAERSLAEVVGANLRGRRAGLGLTQPDLAEWMKQLGHPKWSAPTVSRVEDGKRGLSVDELVTLSLVLGATLQEMLDPVAYDEETPVRVAGTKPANPWALRNLIQGETRVRVRQERDRFVYQISPTNPSGPAYPTLEGMLARPQEYFAVWSTQEEER